MSGSNTEQISDEMLRLGLVSKLENSLIPNDGRVTVVCTPLEKFSLDDQLKGLSQDGMVAKFLDSVMSHASDIPDGMVPVGVCPVVERFEDTFAVWAKIYCIDGKKETK